jgi:nucleoside-diphosphate-sugar epimerase
VKILLTGASSFTGYWFAEALAAAGHHVVAPLRGARDSVADHERSERLRRLADKVELIPECAFGTPAFLEVASSESFDLLCHHGAEVGDYRNPDYDIAAAVAKNTLSLGAVLKTMSERGIKGVVLTGSYFEYEEGAGSQPLLAFSPYGVSKGLTAQIVRHRCHEFAIPYAKFVIPHPFGPLEQPRLGAYLAKTWASGAVAQIRTPAYIRDNIHVSLLAAAYRRFVEEPWQSANERKLNPSGYVESQGAFVQRLAREIGRRLGRDLPVELLHQTEFAEPIMRVNTDPAVRYAADWNESKAWDEYARVFESARTVAVAK